MAGAFLLQAMGLVLGGLLHVTKDLRKKLHAWLGCMRQRAVPPDSEQPAEEDNPDKLARPSLGRGEALTVLGSAEASA